MFSRNSIDGQTVDTIGKGAAPAVFAALNKGLEVKVSPPMHGAQGEPYYISFKDGMYVPKNSMELFSLRQRQRLSKDVVELNLDLLKDALGKVKKAKPVAQTKTEGGAPVTKQKPKKAPAKKKAKGKGKGGRSR